MSTAEILKELSKLTPAERDEIRAKLNEIEGVKPERWVMMVNSPLRKKS